MSTVVYKSAMLEVAGINLSAFVKDLSITYAAAMLDETAMGDDTKKNKGGLFEWSIDATFHQQLQAGAVDATLFALVGTTSCIEVRPFNTCSTVINPRWFGTAILADYPPLQGSVGSLLDVKGSWKCASSLGRSTTAT